MPRADEDLFAELVASGERPRRGRLELIVSLLAHAGFVTSLVLLPLLANDRPPEPAAGGLRVFLSYDPPPPPPPPLPRGRGLAPTAVPKAAPPTMPARPPELVAPSTPTVASDAKPAQAHADPSGGDPSGSLWGEPGGMSGGVEGGVIGGIPGGILGGVIGGTGRGPLPAPVRMPDRPARILRMTRPRYPRDAFVAKREGTVLLEILIDDAGRVASARVLQSVPLLDEAALESVYAWQFAPAIHQGRAVASLAHAPISFRIY